jgi:hypothetical protein
MKECNICHLVLPLEQFYKRKDRKDGYAYACNKCQVERVRAIQLANPEKYAYAYPRVIRRHGLTIEQYEQLKSKHEGMCWICKESPVGTIDHDHACCSGNYSCGKCVRGLLCNNCNWMLGQARESTEILQAGIEYLMASGRVDDGASFTH